ncbi:hypothetical protein B0H14DRAFT_2827605 [Mycena olivaceomarginata]|nr:hypothetical protein B0H14DRAFT_2827605 [Mycena olivaceomarginata]
MPIFSSTSHVQISGGNFVEIGGDFNIQTSLPSEDIDSVLRGLGRLHNIQPSQPAGGVDNMLVDLERLRLGGDSDRQLVGPVRTTMRRRNARMRRPYETSERPLPQIELFQPSDEGSDVEPDLNDPSRHPPTPRIGYRPENELGFPWDHNSTGPATRIRGGTFIGGNVTIIHRHGEAGIPILHRAIAGDAFHDSAERFPQPRCHPETRQKLLDVLWNWACGIEPPRKWTGRDFARHAVYEEDNGPSSPILWLSGPAGSGKSAGRLGGSFFFKRDHPSRGSAQKLFPTIAYQLALIPQLQPIISQTIEKDPAIVDRSLSEQLQRLIIDPCRKGCLSEPVTVVIDGLDECEREAIQQEVLWLVGKMVAGREHLRVLFFIASRPESHIREAFAEPVLTGLHRRLNIEESFLDVEKYLLDEFRRIHGAHRTMATVPSPWPSSEIINDLVSKSSGYFIFASTVIKFIDDKRFRPTERLDIILGIKHNLSASPFDALDQLYHQILGLVPHEFRPQLLGILAAIRSQFELRFCEIERLLDLQPGDVCLILRDLHSVIDIPHEEDQLIAHHASFLDFLEDPSRSSQFYAGSPQCRTALTERILYALSSRHDFLFLHQAANSSTWPMEIDVTIEYITSVEPLPELLPLVQSLNPDFFFAFTGGRLSELATSFLEWIKKFQPLPAHLVHLWEDYTFMALCDDVWSAAEARDTRQSSNGYQILSQTPPQLIRILSVYKVFPDMTKLGTGTRFLLQIRLLLGMSWEELRVAICALRVILGNDRKRLHRLLTANLNDTVWGAFDSKGLLIELARGGLRLLETMINSEEPFERSCRGWGFFLRYCDPSSDLLEGVSRIELASRGRTIGLGAPEDLHNALQWLKVKVFFRSRVRYSFRDVEISSVSDWIDRPFRGTSGTGS